MSYQLDPLLSAGESRRTFFHQITLGMMTNAHSVPGCLVRREFRTQPEST